MSTTIDMSSCECCKKCPKDSVCDDYCQGIYTADITFPDPYGGASGTARMVGGGCSWSGAYYPGGVVNATLYCYRGKWYVHIFVCVINPKDGNYEECDYYSNGRDMVAPHNCPPTGGYTMDAGINEQPGNPHYDVCGAAPTVTLS